MALANVFGWIGRCVRHARPPRPSGDLLSPLTRLRCSRRKRWTLASHLPSTAAAEILRLLRHARGRPVLQRAVIEHDHLHSATSVQRAYGADDAGGFEPLQQLLHAASLQLHSIKMLLLSGLSTAGITTPSHAKVPMTMCRSMGRTVT